MSDLISRQAAIDAFERFIHELGIKDAPYNYGEMALSVQNVPPVEPERKVGRWEYYWNCYYDKYFEYYKCSECNRVIKVVKPAKLINYPYCHCGAKMEGGVNCNAED